MGKYPLIFPFFTVLVVTDSFFLVEKRRTITETARRTLLAGFLVIIVSLFELVRLFDKCNDAFSSLLFIFESLPATKVSWLVDDWHAVVETNR